MLIGAAPHQPAQLSTRATPAAILIVDDDEAVRSVVARALQRLGYAVVQCDSGEKAVSIVEGDGIAFDLVICDTFLGGMNGDETARLIGQARPDLPLITMSGYPRDADDTVGGRPRRYFLAKPFRAHALSALVQQALANA
jgi:CheY-like chemotaxis protein